MNDMRPWRLASFPGVAGLRHIAERAFAPRLRADVLALTAHVDSLRVAHQQLVRQVDNLAGVYDHLTSTVDRMSRNADAARTDLASASWEFRTTADRLERRLSDVGGSVATSNALARRVQRELDRLDALQRAATNLPPADAADAN